MRNTIVLMLILLVLAAGCVKPPAAEEELVTIEGPVVHPAELVEKRGVQTNITEFNELLRRASAIQSYKYTLIDSHETYAYETLARGRFFRINLPKTLRHESGDVFDTVYLDRVTKTALGRCINCEENDMELEKVEFDHFYRMDPYEQMSAFTAAEYTGEDMIGNDYVKVFSGRFKGNPGMIWIQEYWGYPLKIEYETQGANRTIEFEDMEIDTVRTVDIQIPFNCTVKGEDGNWWMWEHYLGEWKLKKTDQEQLLPVVNVEHRV